MITTSDPSPDDLGEATVREVCDLNRYLRRNGPSVFKVGGPHQLAIFWAGVLNIVDVKVAEDGETYTVSLAMARRTA